MIDILRPIIEIAVVIPGFLLAYLPAKAYLKQPPLKLFAWLAPLTICLCIAAGLLCYSMSISTEQIIFLVILIAILIYVHTLKVSRWKSVSIALAICAAFACVNSLSRAFNAMLTTDNALWFCTTAGIIYNLICWLFVFLAWYPATHAARILVEDENMAETWYFFWFLPLVFIGLNLFMIPRYEGTLYQGRIMQGYIVISLVLLILLALFYAMFLIVANSLNRNAKLQQENQFLAMQQVRYDNLCIAIEETRHARHDMHHHLNHLSALAETGELEKLKQYLAGASSKIPNLDMHFSENRAVDSVIGHYYTLAERENIPFSTRIDLPDELPTNEMDTCLVLSNLLENALEASIRTDVGKRYIKVEAYIHSGRLLLIAVENAFDGDIREKDGVFRSSKRKGNGVGIQSVRRTAEKNGGDSAFTYANGVFTAKIMLRS